MVLRHDEHFQFGHFAYRLAYEVQHVCVFYLIFPDVELFQLVFDCKEDISELPRIVHSSVTSFILAKLVVAEIQDLQLLEVLELMLEAFEAPHAKPVAGEVKVLQGFKIEHVLEVEAILFLDAVVRNAELLKFGPPDSHHELVKIVND